MKKRVLIVCFILVVSLIPVNCFAASNGVQSKVVWDKEVTKTVSGYAGNQPKGGSRFPSGGGFYYGDSGGPSVAVSVYGVSVSIPLGQVKSSGIYVAVPDKTHYYKLYVSKRVKIRTYTTYRKTYDYKSKKYVWKKYTRGANKTVISQSFSAKRVK